MRRFWFFLALLLLGIAIQPATAWAGSTYDEFIEAWSERDTRYVERHATLDQNARAATAAFLADPASPDSGLRLEQMLGTIKAASYMDGRGMMLRDLRIFMAKKPSAARTELWMQERSADVRSQAEDLAAELANLNRMTDQGLGGSDAYFEGTVAIVVMSATLQGKVEELTLIDQN